MIKRDKSEWLKESWIEILPEARDWYDSNED